jgi:hypothetical protein
VSIKIAVAGFSLLLLSSCATTPSPNASVGASRAESDPRAARYSAYDYRAPAYPGPAMGAPSYGDNREPPPLRGVPRL